MPSDEEYEKAENSLEKNSFQFDYVITHSAPTSVQKEVAPTYEINKLTDFLEDIKNNISCEKCSVYAGKGYIVDNQKDHSNGYGPYFFLKLVTILW